MSVNSVNLSTGPVGSTGQTSRLSHTQYSSDMHSATDNFILRQNLNAKTNTSGTRDPMIGRKVKIDGLKVYIAAPTGSTGRAQSNFDPLYVSHEVSQIQACQVVQPM
jgi:hypothetical protein